MDYFEPKTVLIVVTLMVCLAIVLDLLRRRKRNRYDNIHMSSRDLERTARGEPEDDPFSQSQFPSGRSRVVKVRDEADTYSSDKSSSQMGGFNSSLTKQPQQGALSLGSDGAEDNALAEKAGSAEVNKSEAVKQSKQSQSKESTSKDAEPEDVLVMHLMTDKGQTCCGQLLLDTAVSLGLRYGAMKIFHRHSEEDGSGPVLFSMANLLNPGTFDLNTMGDMQSVGVTLFMTPNELEEPVDAFDIMLETAEKLAQELQLTLKDESRSSMTKQTIDHYRQKALKIAFQRQRST